METWVGLSVVTLSITVLLAMMGLVYRFGLWLGEMKIKLAEFTELLEEVREDLQRIREMVDNLQTEEKTTSLQSAEGDQQYDLVNAIKQSKRTIKH